MFSVVAIQKDGRLFGTDVLELVSSSDSNATTPIETISADGVRIINSTELAKDVVGFGGRTPVELHIEHNKISHIEVLPNSETPSFYEQVLESRLLERFIGQSLTDIATTEYDAVSGATYTSQAIINNIQRAAQYAANVTTSNTSPFSALDLKSIAGILVILMGAFLTLARIKNQRLIIVQQVLNVIVLGFWCGSFLSFTTFTSWASNGVNLSLSLVTIFVFIVILIMPLLGKKGTYCSMHCPMGSAQELIGRIPAKKIQFKPKTAKFLNKLRYYILAALLFLMWIGVGFDLMNWEIFSAFVYKSASTGVLLMAACFLLLSVFTPRPYCRFVCPTGAILTISQKTKD